ncbi:MAG TPA: PucR family transcriptional regulator ligand-binding domain-containing protein [Actinomycetes bacterium]|nr:PucR family transcriptional regulator ligand-binding domain-containing protein [Actinomycetes bacterium]
MLPTVAEVLQLAAVRRGAPRVVAGQAGLGQPVRWVHVSEVIDIARELSGGELVLTTGIALPEDASALAAYIDDLADVGVVGVAVELGRRYDRTLPTALVKAAERRGLPLVELHRGTPFVNITESVHALIVDAQLAELRSSDEVHQIFTELSVEGAEPDEIMRHVARMTGNPVVLENLAHQVLGYDAAGTDAGELLRNWETKSRSAGVAARTGYDETAAWLLTTVGARGHDWGRLVLVCAERPLPRHTVVLERAASSIALNVLVQRDQASLERQSHRTLLTGILTHAYPAAELAVRAKAIGVPLDGRRLVGIVVRLPAARGGGLEAQARLRDVGERVGSALRSARLIALVGAIDEGSLGVLLSLDRRAAEDAALDELAEAVRKASAGAGPGPGPGPGEVIIGVGTAVEGVRDARRTLLEAGQVADAARHEASGRSWYRLLDVRLRGLLHLLRADARVQTYVEREVGPLLAHDARHGTNLAEALAVYLQHGGNKSAAAAAAHLSRPSFYERLRRIERILGVDLDSVESRLSLHVALLALESVRAD